VRRIREIAAEEGMQHGAARAWSTVVDLADDALEAVR
jgi:hypothetical protein